MQEQKLLEKIQAVCQNALTDSLTGIYLHGSLAFGCFQWEKSDIDFLVVVHRKPTQKEKESLLSGLLVLEGDCPPKGLEMSVVLENVCNPFVYPTPFELHYSKFHRERARKNPADFCRSMNGTDPDLAAHMTVVQKAGIVLCGPEISRVFAPVPRACYLDSILRDAEDAPEEIQENPVYYVLNLCRVLACLEEGQVLSKQQGGEWGLKHLSEKYGPLIQQSLDAYAGKGEVCTPPESLVSFAEEMLARIHRLSHMIL